MKRYLYFDYLRCIAVFAVVCIHITVPSYPMSITDTGWEISLAYNATARFGVPLFFMISGALFLNTDKLISNKYILRKTLRILLCFLIFSFFYDTLWYFLKYGFVYRKDVIILKYIPNLIGGWYHLWFLQALVVLYLLTPILRLIVINKKITEYVLLLLFLCCSLMPFCDFFFEFEVYTGKLIKNLSFQLPQYSLYYVLGHYLHGQVLNCNKFIVGGGILVILCLIIIGDIVLSNKGASPVNICSAYMSPMVVIYTSLIFLFAKSTTLKDSKIVSELSILSFGIYLVHDVFLKISWGLNILPLKENLLFVIPVFAFVVLILSGMLVKCIRIIPFFKSIL